MKEKRNVSVDIARGLAIVVMIMGHVCIGIERWDRIFSIWYHAWHMPLFFFFSGYFFSDRDESIRNFISLKAKRLIVPFFIWTIINTYINYIYSGDLHLFYSETVNSILGTPTLNVVGSAGALWFLPAIFWANIIHKVFIKVFNNPKLKFCVSIFVGMIGMLIETKGIHFPLGIDAALVGVLFMAIGETFRRNSENIFINEIINMRWFTFFIFFIITNISIFYNGEVNFRTGDYQNFLLTSINAVLGTILTWNIARCLERINNYFKSILFLETIGKDSIIYLCLNQRIITIINPVFYVTSNSYGITILKFIIMTSMVVFICYVIGNMLLGSKHLKILMGK